jgi:HEAT repeat protein
MKSAILKNTVVSSALLLGLGFASPATAGRGSSPGAIQRAIGSGSVETIEAELERSESLVCHACVNLVLPLVDHEETRVRKVAAWWLSRRGMRPEMSLQMVQRLSQPDSKLARNAADVLGEMRAYKSIKPLGAALNNPIFNDEARAAMARAIGEIGDMEGLAPLSDATKAPEPAVRAAALESLRKLRGYTDMSLAVTLLLDPDQNVRVEAIYSVANARSAAAGAASAPDAAARLTQLVSSDPSELVRKKAAWALGEIHASAAIAGPALERASTQDTSPFVKSLAYAALAKLAP